MIDHTDVAATDKAQATPCQTIAYLQEMLGEMMRMADAATFKTLAYLIDVARAEAELLAKAYRQLD